MQSLANTLPVVTLKWHSTHRCQLMMETKTDGLSACGTIYEMFFQHNTKKLRYRWWRKFKKKRMANYCHFTGGGDLRISRTGFEFLLMTTENTESGGMSPIDQGEVRETLDIECKQSTNAEIRYQLMANMYNLLVRQFTSKLSEARTTQQLSHVLQLSKISLYGMSIGICRPVEILKLKVDFDKFTLGWEVKFENCSSLPKELLIDSCIIAVVKRLSKKSPSPPIAWHHTRILTCLLRYNLFFTLHLVNTIFNISAKFVPN